jgi:capsular exopolysaccharide synthesis family protein
MPQSVETEALRQLRAKIALLSGGNFPRVITVVSYDSGEGKTLTSANLALESANSGLRTLVIDGDMRRGDLHEIFQLPNINGLGDVLQSNKPLGDLLPYVLLDSGYENLTIMPCGRSESDPAALLGRSRFNDLVDLLATRYDSVIIDSAPTIGGPDSAFLGGASDGMIIVVNARRTRLSSLKRSIEELRAGSNVNLIGVVFNRVRLQITSKYNNNYYRQTPALPAEKLNKEMARSGTGLFALRRHIITDRAGERLYSTTACATRMGVRRRTVRSWIASGYLKSERRYFRRWIRESAITAILEQRVSAVPPAPVSQNGVATTTESVNGTHNQVPEKLREQREAILDFLSQPPRTDPEN